MMEATEFRDFNYHAIFHDLTLNWAAIFTPPRSMASVRTSLFNLFQRRARVPIRLAPTRCAASPQRLRQLYFQTL
jgi:hypothetical protein